MNIGHMVLVNTLSSVFPCQVPSQLMGIGLPGCGGDEMVGTAVVGQGGCLGPEGSKMSRRTFQWRSVGGYLTPNGLVTKKILL